VTVDGNSGSGFYCDAASLVMTHNHFQGNTKGDYYCTHKCTDLQGNCGCGSGNCLVESVEASSSAWDGIFTPEVIVLILLVLFLGFWIVRRRGRRYSRHVV